MGVIEGGGACCGACISEAEACTPSSKPLSPKGVSGLGSWGNMSDQVAASVNIESMSSAGFTGGVGLRAGAFSFVRPGGGSEGSGEEEAEGEVGGGGAAALH